MTSYTKNSKTPIEDKIELFVSKLTPKKIYQFVEECKKRHLQTKIKESENKINFQTFTFIMKNIWKERSDEYSIIEQLMEIIFNRFKTVKCQINTENYKEDNGQNKNKEKPKKDNNPNPNKTDNYYYVSDINTDEKEIDVYEISLVFTIFMKCSFKEKIEVLFNITDVDNDGYINKKEINKLVQTVNYIFADEQSPIAVKSSLISQSLASIKAKGILDQILFSPGNLIEIIKKEKYILFEELINAIEKVPNYKFIILPKVNIIDSLNIRKKEPEININKKDLKEFLSITSDILSATKDGSNSSIQSNPNSLNVLNNTLNNANNNNILINKLKENQKKNNTFPKIETKKMNQIFTTQITKNNINNNDNKNFTNKIVDQSNSAAYISTKEDSSIEGSNHGLSQANTNSKKKLKEKKFRNQNNNIESKFKVGYEKLNNIEIQPGLLKIKELGGNPLIDPNRKYIPISKIIDDLDYYTYKKVSDFDNQIEELLKQKKYVNNQFVGVKEKIKGPAKPIQFSLSFLTHQGKEYKPKNQSLL